MTVRRRGKRAAASDTDPDYPDELAELDLTDLDELSATEWKEEFGHSKRRPSLSEYDRWQR